MSRNAPLVELQASALNASKAASFQCGDRHTTWAADVMGLKYSAKRMMSLPLTTVVDKTGVAPSGDRHDYFSIGRYFWPDPAKPDGLPWQRRDGQVNPTILTDQYDKNASDALFRAVPDLALGYFYLGDEAYADRAAEYLRAWFIAPETRMNPRLNYAEGVPGETDGRPQGLIEFSKLVDLFDAVALLTGSKAWTAADQDGLRAWMSQYHEWLDTHPNAKLEENAHNNHGTYFDAQHAALAIFLGQVDEARSILEAAKTRRIAAQIAPDGFQPQETLRASGWFYSVFNVKALMNLAAIGDRVGVDLWHYKTDDGRSIQLALDTLLPFAFDGKTWPYTGAMDTGRLFEPLTRAAAALGEPRYAALAKSLGDSNGDGDTEDDDKARGTVRLLWGHAAGAPAADH